MSATPRPGQSSCRRIVLTKVPCVSRDVRRTQQRSWQRRGRCDDGSPSVPPTRRIGTVACALAPLRRDRSAYADERCPGRASDRPVWCRGLGQQNLTPNALRLAPRRLRTQLLALLLAVVRFAQFRHSRRLCLKLVTPQFCWGRWVELRGFEPLTPSMRTRCATGLRPQPLNRDDPPVLPRGPSIRVSGWTSQLARRVDGFDREPRPRCTGR